VTKLSEGGIVGGVGAAFFVCVVGGGDSVKLVPKKWLARERYVCVFIFVEREREREREREDI